MRHAMIIRYMAFAVLATMANLVSQRMVLSAGSSAFQFALAVGTGTVVGLIMKYLLDKRWIFYDTRSGLYGHGHQFALYSAIGLLTTGVFWGFETVFWLIWHDDAMRELGAVFGLIIGYVAKFKLDQRFVFTHAKVRVA